MLQNIAPTLRCFIFYLHKIQQTFFVESVRLPYNKFNKRYSSQALTREVSEENT